MFRFIENLIDKFIREYNEDPNLVIVPDDMYQSETQYNRFYYMKYNDTPSIFNPDILEHNIKKIELRIIVCKHIEKPIVLKAIKHNDFY